MKWIGYKPVIVETFRQQGEPSDANLRVRPVSGQGLPVQMRVECSRDMRTKYPVGTKFRIKAKITNKEGGQEFLYSHYNSKFEVLE